MSRSDQAFHTHTAVELVHLEFKSESRGGLVAERSCPHLSLSVRKLTGPFHSEAEKYGRLNGWRYGQRPLTRVQVMM